MAAVALSPAETVEAWVRTFPVDDGIFRVSEARRYNSDEGAYNARYGGESADRTPGEGLVALARESGADFAGAALEVGCGTGKASAGLVASQAYPLTVITDSSPVFVDITRRTCEGLDTGRRARYGVLRGEDIGRLPAGAFSLIAMRAVLHHITDVGGLVADAARLLLPGGVMICQEPCWEGLVLRGLLAQFGVLLADAAGAPLPEADGAKVRDYVEAVRWCVRRDVDKSKREDKHGFRPDELSRLGSRHGLSMEFHANITLQSFNLPPPQRRRHRFPKAFLDHLRVSTELAPETMRVLEERLAPCLALLDTAARGGTGPYFYGVFVFKKA